MATRQSIVSITDSVPVYRYRFYSGVDFPPVFLKDRNIYRRRWIIVLIFSVFALIQGSEWSSWWYASHVAHKLYHWTDASVTLLGCMSAFTFLCALVPVAKLIGHFGQRCATILGTSFLVLGAFLRYWFVAKSASLSLPIVSSVIVGICGAVTFIGPTVISAAWFPRRERFLATGLMMLAGTNLAMGFSFVITDCLIPNLLLQNETMLNGTMDRLHDELDRIYLLELILCAVTCVTVLVYFPNRPPTSPSYSAQMPRLPFSLSAREAMSNPSFWILLFTRTVPQATQVSLLRALRVEMEALGITQLDSMWLGPSACLIGAVGGIGFCLLADHFPLRIRSILGGLNTAASVACFLLALTCYGVLAPGDADTTRTLFFIFVMSTTFSASATIPLYAELVCEVTYPAHEAAVQSLHGLAQAFTWAICFSYVPFSGFWILTVLSATFLVSALLIFCVQRQLLRTDEDFESDDP